MTTDTIQQRLKARDPKIVTVDGREAAGRPTRLRRTLGPDLITDRSQPIRGYCFGQ